ncbi:MAG TPA: PQQ-binding-like beta-propeller repeat protein [Candidatus Elarobacter sp.]|nr:PQQ-binding-like beta-propeller repeat protein [Candidatus Elarobacter sp.]
MRCLPIVVSLTGRFGFAFFLAAACACAQSAVSTVAQPEPQRTIAQPAPQASRAPQAWEGPGETTSPLPVARGAAVDVAPPHAAPRALALPALADGAKLLASAGGVAYYFTGTDQQEVVHALDLATGAERWQVAGLRAYDAAASSALLFAGREQPDGNGGTVALDALTGHVVATLPSVGSGHVLDGYYYAYRYRGQSTAFVAFDGTSGREMWESLGTGGIGGPPALVGTTLLQSFSQSGAILVNAMHGFDVVTGRERWAHGYGPAPLGVAGNLLYLDSTWFPVQLDAYFPLAVTTLDVTTGTVLHEYGYKPDAARNWPRKPNTPYGATGSHVAGGFVYLQVAGAWYRYDADRPPADAHPVRLDGVEDIAAWFDGGAMIVSSRGETAVARSAGELTLHRVGTGVPRSRVGVRADGRRYVVVGDALYAFDPRGEHAQRLGAVACASLDDLVLWDAHVAVICAAGSGGARRELLFDDLPVRAVAVAPHPEPTAAPAFALRVVQYPVPPAGPTPIDRQWWPSAMAPGPGGTLAIALTPGGGIDRRSGIGRVDAQGRVAVSMLTGNPAPWPRDVAVDAHGTVWFNDERAANVLSIDRGGATHAVLIGVPTPAEPAAAEATRAPRPARIGRFLGAIRLAIGPDGEAWFARSHPTRTIGRVDGTAHVDVPDDVGDVLALRGARDGFWFATASALGFMTRTGTLSRVALPDGFFARGYPAPRLAVAPDGTVWVGAAQAVAHADRHGVLRTVRLPNASARLSALTVGCDGTLYAADMLGTQLARITPDGALDEYATGLYSIDALETATDCRIWFVGGSNAPEQQVGTFTFTARAGRSR